MVSAVLDENTSGFQQSSECFGHRHRFPPTRIQLIRIRTCNLIVLFYVEIFACLPRSNLTMEHELRAIDKPVRNSRVKSGSYFPERVLDGAAGGGYGPPAGCARASQFLINEAPPRVNTEGLS